MKTINVINLVKAGFSLIFISFACAFTQAQPKHELYKSQYKILSKDEMKSNYSNSESNQSQLENSANYKTAPKSKKSADLPDQNPQVDYITTGVGAKNNYKSQFTPKN